ncbi:DDE-type integrase/transposase/recombinase [Streptosporangium amethystogenes]|uniref:DDE-type integrase/transposase/recombinase n=1 Tax=Streptosporangium amethystogenes TaxID=2002 RepID=UPI0004C78D19|nr:DDE-type integrase/transposase/recombinase [Streptosporangium amethystogenes]
MSGAGTRLGVGTHFRLDGETVEVVEIFALPTGMEVLLKDGRDRLQRMSVRELMTSGRAQVIPNRTGPVADDPGDLATVMLATLSKAEKAEVLERASHVREMLFGYRSGTPELPGADEPRPQYSPDLPLARRYAAKASELGIGVRTLERWAMRYHADGEAGLVLQKGSSRTDGLGRADPRWVETALEVMAEYTEESQPSVKIVIERVRIRLEARFGADVVKVPKRTTAYRWMEELERRQPTFRLSTKRNRDIASRPGGVYGKLRPTRPGEYLLMDTTRLDVFALDPGTLQWMQAELTVAMDWYTRCITGIRVTPVSTKAVDAAAVLFQTYRPQPIGPSWPEGAAWPDHGIPRTVLVDKAAVDGPLAAAAGPAMVPETLVVDHGKIFLSEHLLSVCRRLGISVQPARLRTGRDKGPIERFFKTLREDLLQVLPGYKGPDIHTRGVNPEKDAFLFHHELEAMIREWVAVDYHRRPHGGLLDPHLPKFPLSPVKMFEHGIARAGYIEVPRDSNLAYEFLEINWRTIQHYGIEIDSRRYNGDALDICRDVTSSHGGRAKGRWPICTDPDDVTRAYFRDPVEHRWHTLWWEHAPDLKMPLSDEALKFARQLAAKRYTYPNDKLAVGLLLERWSLGLGNSLSERRMALRLSREQLGEGLPGAETEPSVATLPSVSRILSLPKEPAMDEAVQCATDTEASDDDDIDLEDLNEELGFYATALKDVDD